MFNKHVAEQLSAYHHKELAAEEARQVAEHLLNCERCRTEYEEIKLGIHLAEQLPQVSAPASMWGEIETLLDEQSRKPEPQPRYAWLTAGFGKYRYATAITISLVVLSLAAVLYFTRDRSSPQIASEGDRTDDTVERHTPPHDNQVIPPRKGTPEQAAKEPATAEPNVAPQLRAWNVERLDGTPKIGSNPIQGTGSLAVGQWLETDGASRARLDVGNIGHVEIDPNTRIRLVEARSNEHRLALARGRMQAKIYAPPRLFFVNTPSAVAVDYGCAYTLEVDDAGRSLLHVTSGWVAFVSKGRESMVPAGGACVTRPGAGPGTPYFEDATATFLNALTRFDFENGGVDALNVMIDEARQRDTLTLWHLLARVNKSERARIFERMAALVPAPEGVTKEGVLKLNQRMLNLWKEELQWNW